MVFAEIINQKYDIREAWVLCFGDYPPSGKCYCPFHENTNSPAAKVYDYGMRCFGKCSRVYFPFNFFKAFRPDILEAEKKIIHVATPAHKPVVKTPPPELSSLIKVEDKISAVIKYLSNEDTI